MCRREDRLKRRVLCGIRVPSPWLAIVRPFQFLLQIAQNLARLGHLRLRQVKSAFQRSEESLKPVILNGLQFKTLPGQQKDAPFNSSPCCAVIIFANFVRRSATSRATLASASATLAASRRAAFTMAARVVCDCVSRSMIRAFVWASIDSRLADGHAFQQQSPQVGTILDVDQVRGGCRRRVGSGGKAPALK